MTLVVGVDPGTSGAFAVYDTLSRTLCGPVQDVPVWFQVIGKTKRPRVDAMAIADMFDVFNIMGVELVVMEEVGGRPGQNAMHAFTFGYGVAIIYMAAFYSGIPIETVKPAVWKQLMNVPGKSKADDSAIIARADELFPRDREQFRGERGGLKVDRAEASIIAMFGGDRILQTAGVAKPDLRALYRAADTGA